MSNALSVLKSRFSVSKRFSYTVKDTDGAEVLTLFFTPLTLAEREKAKTASRTDDANEFALSLLIQKAQDEAGNRLFMEGNRAELKNELPASVLEDMMLAVLNQTDAQEVEQVKTELKSK